MPLIIFFRYFQIALRCLGFAGPHDPDRCDPNRDLDFPRRLVQISRGSLDVPGVSNQADVGEKWPPAQRILDEFMISVWDEAHEFLYGTTPMYSVVYCLGRSP